MTDQERFDVVTEIRQIKKRFEESSKKIEEFGDTVTEMRLHIKQGDQWRTAILGVVVTIVLQALSFTFFYGQLTKMVQINTDRLECLEKLHPRVNG